MLRRKERHANESLSLHRFTFFVAWRFATYKHYKRSIHELLQAKTAEKAHGYCACVLNL
jgi:hypothetical protein